MAAAADMHPTDDHSHRFWTYPEWIQANGGRLTEENVLDYFATSMFWDRTSDNQAMKMQMQFSEARPTDIAAELKSRWTGIQFAVIQADAPTFFLVHKLKRDSPDRTTPLAAYFIMHNRIFQCPDVYNVVANRLLSAFHGLESSLKIIRSHKPEFSPRWGFSWPVDLSGMKAEAQRRAATARASVEPATPAAATPGTPAAQPAGGADIDPTASAAVASVMTGSTKKAVNTMPMFLALSTTTAHSIATLPDLQPVPLVAEEPTSTSTDAVKPTASSGAVPPAPTSDAAPAPVATTKRKRKRTNAAATPAATPAASS